VARMAVDIVLLPSQEMMDKAIEANRKLRSRRPDKIGLNKVDCLPHISLAMGCIDETDVPNIEKALGTIAKDHPLGPLSVAGIHTETDAAGRQVSVLKVRKTRQLQALHEAVMRELAPCFGYPVTSDVLLSEETVGESTLRWIRDYPEKSSFEKFSPHITIGFGRTTEALPSPIRFHAGQLALCHLGNHCTCRKVLVSVGLSAQS